MLSRTPPDRRRERQRGSQLINSHGSVLRGAPRRARGVYGSRNAPQFIRLVEGDHAGLQEASQCLRGC